MCVYIYKCVCVYVCVSCDLVIVTSFSELYLNFFKLIFTNQTLLNSNHTKTIYLKKG